MFFGQKVSVSSMDAGCGARMPSALLPVFVVGSAKSHQQNGEQSIPMEHEVDKVLRQL